MEFCYNINFEYCYKDKKWSTNKYNPPLNFKYAPHHNFKQVYNI